REERERPIEETLASFLSVRALLLVLDNCEHLVDACARLADLLLGACPGLRILATSRQPFGVPGERLWRVPPMDLPCPDASRDDSVGRACVAGNEAVRLFASHARAAISAFALTPE